MFSLITRWFKKSDDEKDDSETEEPTYTKGDPIPHSLDFTGADRIHISAKDCVRDNIDSVGRDIYDTLVIRRAVELLDALPEEGEQHMNTDDCLEHVITAYKEEVPFARMHFFDGRVQLMNDLFLSERSPAIKAQAELFDIIHIRRTPKG